MYSTTLGVVTRGLDPPIAPDDVDMTSDEVSHGRSVVREITWKNGSSFMVTGEDFGDTSVRYPQLTTDVTGSDSDLSHFDDADTDVIGKRPAIDEDSAELVHFSVSMTGIHRMRGSSGRTCVESGV